MRSGIGLSSLWFKSVFSTQFFPLFLSCERVKEVAECRWQTSEAEGAEREEAGVLELSVETAGEAGLVTEHVRLAHVQKSTAPRKR